MRTTISAEELEASCLELIDQVAEEGQIFVITKDGRPIAKMMPMPPGVEMFGAMRASGPGEEDIISPIEGVCELKELADPDESARTS